MYSQFAFMQMDCVCERVSGIEKGLKIIIIIIIKYFPFLK